MQREGWIGVRPYRRAKEIHVAPTLTVFPAPDVEGARLAQEIVGLGTTVGYDCRIETEYSLRTGMRAQLCDAVAVYDLTTDGTIVGAYRALSALYTFFDHVLLVSRTPLPLNLLPARAGGAPPYPYPAKQLPDGSPVRFPQFSLSGAPSDEWIGDGNHSLLTWLQHQLRDLIANPTAPRLPREPSFDPLWPYSDDVRGIVADLGSPVAWRRESEDSVFLSYRGARYEAALQLASRAESEGIAGAGRKHIRVVSPSEFAMERELMSAGRRWMVISYLRMLIFNAPEFWIYQTEDYLGSWWTLAELVLAGVAVSKGEEGLLQPPRLRVYDPSADQVHADDGMLVRMGKRVRTRVEYLSGLARPGVSSPTLDPLGRQKRPTRLPLKVGGRRDWEAFWNLLLIDRRTIGESSPPYASTVKAFLDGLGEMVPFDERYIAAASASDGIAWARDGTRLRVAKFVPRMLFTVPSSVHPEREILRLLPTFYALP